MWRRIITSSRPICDQIEQGCSIDLRSWRIKWTKEEGGHYCRGSWQEKWRRRRPLDPATTSNPNPNRPFRDANFTPRDQPEPRQISWTAADIPRAPDGTGCRRPNVPPTGHWVTDKAQLPGAVNRRRDWSVSFAPDPAGAIKKILWNRPPEEQSRRNPPPTPRKPTSWRREFQKWTSSTIENTTLLSPFASTPTAAASRRQYRRCPFGFRRLLLPPPPRRRRRVTGKKTTGEASTVPPAYEIYFRC